MEVSFLNKIENKTKQELVYQIRSLIDNDNFPVKAGDVGGWISSEANLSQKGSCWISPNTIVVENARIEENAFIYGESIISGSSKVNGRAEVTQSRISGYSLISGNAEVEMSILEEKCSIHGESKIVSSHLRNVETKKETTSSFSDTKLESDELITFAAKAEIFSSHLSFQKKTDFQSSVHLEGVTGTFTSVYTHSPLVMHNVFVEDICLNVDWHENYVGSTISGESPENLATFKNMLLMLCASDLNGNLYMEGLSSSQTTLSLSDCHIRDYANITILGNKKSRTNLVGCNLSGSSILKIHGMITRIIQDITLKNDEVNEI